MKRAERFLAAENCIPHYFPIASGVSIEYDFRQRAAVDNSVGRYMTFSVEILGTHPACGFQGGLYTRAHIVLHTLFSSNLQGIA